MFPASDDRFGPKVGNIGFKWDKFRYFPDQFSVNVAHRAKYIPKTDLNKPRISPTCGQSDPFGPKSDNPAFIWKCYIESITGQQKYINLEIINNDFV